MSIRRSSSRGALAAGVTVASVILLTDASTAVAAADPPALNYETCATTLDRVQVWPGVVSAAPDVRLVSDSFDSYVYRQPRCRTAN